MRRTKIVCTLGPASSSPKIIGELIRAGMDVARLNFSHGNHERHDAVLSELHEQAKKLDRPVAVLVDLQGPKIRVGEFHSHGILLKNGSKVTVTSRPVIGDDVTIPVNYDQLSKEVKKGDRLLMDDGLIELSVETVRGKDILAKVVVGGTLSSHKGVNLPGIELSISSLSPKDHDDLGYALDRKVDFIALSFVRSLEDILELRREIERRGSKQHIIAKIEKPEALSEIHEIIATADGIMVARGDLGVEMGPEQVPIAQKKIISNSIMANKPVITATQMLESMTHNPRPTRAEASDVANAIFDRTDAVMLSGETSVGNYPVETVKMMDRIIRRAEKYAATQGIINRRRRAQEASFAETISEAAYHAAREVNAKAIVAFTQTGSTARLISKRRPDARLLAFTMENRVFRQLLLPWGITPRLIPRISSIDEMITTVDRLLCEEGFVRAGDNILIVSGAPIGENVGTNMLTLHEIEQH